MPYLRLCYFAVALMLLITVSSCSSTPQTPDDEEAETPDEADVAEEHVDPGPQYDRNLGEVIVEQPPAEEVEAVSVYQDGDHYYVAVNRAFDNVSRLDWLDVSGERHGMVVLDMAGDVPPLLVVRLVGGEMPEDLELTVVESTMDYDRLQTVVTENTLQVVGIDGADDEPELAERFKKRLPDYFARFSFNMPGDGNRSTWTAGDAGPFYRYAYFRTRMWGADDIDEADDQIARDQPSLGRRNEMGQLMATYTGLLSVEEALQMDRALMVRETAQEQTVALEDIEAAAPDELPWEEMIGELDNEPVLEPMADAIPADHFYLHFQDIRKFLAIAGQINDLAPSISQVFEGRGGVKNFPARYETELAIARTGLSEHIGHMAVDGIALVASDPFVRDGSALSVVFDIKNRDMLHSALEHYESQIRKDHDVEVTQLEIGGESVRVLSDEYGRVNQFRLEFDDQLILSNSEQAIEKFVAVNRGDAPALSAAGDFRYMRALYPYDSDAEDGFAFFGDAFVADAISPETRILLARRHHAQADLTAVNHAALLFGWLEGRRPTDVDELIESGLLFEEELEHADGERIEFDPARGASSSWGRVDAMAPLAARTIDGVTEAEREAYEQFRLQYEGRWSQFIDPVGARVVYGDDGELEIDAHMVPLVDAREYEELARQVGDRTMAAPQIDDVLQWTQAVGDDNSWRRQVEMMARQFTSDRDIGLGWLGDWVMGGVADRSGLWDFALRAERIPKIDEAQANQGGIINDVWTLPVYAGAHVSNRVGLATALTALKSFVESAAPGMIDWDERDSYRDTPIVAVREAGVPAGESMTGPGLYYAVPGDIFVVSPDLTTLKILIDASLDEQLIASEPVDEPQMQSMLHLRPDSDESWVVKTLLGFFEAYVTKASDDAASGLVAVTRGLPDIADSPDEWSSAAMTYLGFEPQHPHGGEWHVDEHGQIRHSSQMGDTPTLWRSVPVESSPVSEFLTGLDELALQLAMVGEGNHRGLRVRINVGPF